MKTQGEIEAAICDGMTRFEQEYMGRGPKDIHAFLVRDLLIVRLQGVLTAAEQQLVKTLPVEKGRDLLKQVRTQVKETAGVAPVSWHHDIRMVTGEEVVLFTPAEAPLARDQENHGRSKSDFATDARMLKRLVGMASRSRAGSPQR